MLFFVLSLLSPAQAATYSIDASHTHVGFAVKHMMVSTVRGEFGTVSGTVEFDPAKLTATSVTAEVAVDSVDTREAKRDGHLKSPDFFDASAFPKMNFVSKKVQNVGADGSMELVGDLTIRGVTKSVVFKVSPFSKEYKDPWGTTKVGTTATTTINRQDFGVKWNTALDGGGYVVGDEVSITLDVELNKK